MIGALSVPLQKKSAPLRYGALPVPFKNIFLKRVQAYLFLFRKRVQAYLFLFRKRVQTYLFRFRKRVQAYLFRDEK